MTKDNRLGNAAAFPEGLNGEKVLREEGNQRKEVIV